VVSRDVARPKAQWKKEESIAFRKVNWKSQGA
jgi:hypothetical protein